VGISGWLCEEGAGEV
jgi:hypothetical protein